MAVAIDILIVAGGGSGGGNNVGGGGGAGGVFYQTGMALTAGASTVTIGAGGIGDTSIGANGQNSSFGTLVVFGGGAGGGGGWTSAQKGYDGGSGGGCNGGNAGLGGTIGLALLHTNPAGYQGNNGSLGYGGASTPTRSSGGGGGAGAVGQNAASYNGGDGGDGISCDITGTEVWYGGGGGGGTNNTSGHGIGGLGGGGIGTSGASTVAGDGVAGTGGGGGGLREGIGGSAGDGGTGVVVIRYLTSDVLNLFSGGVVTTDGDYTIHTFTDSGELLAPFDLSIVPDSRKLRLTLDSTAITEDQFGFPLTVGLDYTNPLHAELFDTLDYPEANDDFTGVATEPPNVIRWVRQEDGGSDFYIQNDTLQVGISATITAESFKSIFLMRGDFDVQTDFEVISSTDANYWYLSFFAALTDRFGTDYLRMERQYNGAGYYSSTIRIGDTNNNAGGTTSDISGKFRLVRKGVVGSTYTWNGSGWTQVGSTSGVSTDDFYIQLRAETTVSNKSLIASFDNFLVNSGTVVWPDSYNNTKKLSIVSGIAQLPVEIESWGKTKLNQFVYANTDPIAHWTMDNISGTTLVDEMGNNTGNIVNMTQTSGGKFDKYLAGRAATANTLVTVTPFTPEAVSVWFKVTDISLEHNVFGGTINGTAAIPLAVRNTANFNKVAIFNGSVFVNSGFTVTDTEWHHAVLIKDSTITNSWWIWLDGVQGTIIALPGTLLIDFIGRGAASGWASASVDNIQVYDYVLSGPEITELYLSSVYHAVLHTKVPLYSASIDTELILYYDSTQLDNPSVGYTGEAAAQTVWDGDFAFVSHQAQDPSGTAPQILDSTSNAKHGTASGAMTSGDLVDNTINYDGLDDMISYTPTLGLGGDFIATMEAFIRPNVLDTCSPVSMGLNGTATAFSLLLGATGTVIVAYAQSNNYVTTGTPIVINEWAHIAATKTSGQIGSTTKIFVDGVDSPGTGPTTTPNLTATYFRTGQWVDDSVNAYAYNGALGEVRVSVIVRSDDWIKLTNLSLTDQLITWSNLYLYTFTGYVQLEGVPAVRPVLMFNRDTYELETWATSASGTGYFELTTTNSGIYFVNILPELNDTYNILAYDKIILES